MPYHIDQFREVFDEHDWDVGVLSRQDLMACAVVGLKYRAQPHGLTYFTGMSGPGKMRLAKDLQHSLWHKIESALVLVRRSHESLDYSLYLEADDILQSVIPHPLQDPRWRQLTVEFLDEKTLRYLHNQAPWLSLYFDFKTAAILAGVAGKGIGYTL